tara:strand:+ start:277 stop:942 length:666 start_codon:yes stop_codon:yes gene_type:complete
MALNKLKFNSINVTPAANQGLKFNSSADGFETGSAGGAITFIKKLTASSSGDLSFVDGSSDVVLDNTYKEYIFMFKDIHPQTDNVKFQFQGNASGGSGYNETLTTTTFGSGNHESNGFTIFNYEDSADQAQGTSFQNLTANSSLGNDNDQCLSGYFHLFNPSSTTFVKHFIIATQYTSSSDYQISDFIAGYFNTTSAIDEIQFKMSSGNVDAGTITLYGIN